MRGVSPAPCTERALLEASFPRERRIWLFAIGKGAHAMAAGAVAALHRSLNQVVGGLVVAPERAPPPCATVEVCVGDHPVPGRQSFAAAQRLGEVAAGRRASDLAVVLLSGGASSLIGAPLRGMSERHVSQLFELLLGSGLDVRAMNSIRKRFTRWGAGRLTLALAPAGVHCLLLSDVVGDAVHDIGSGPCVPDAMRAADIATLLADSRLWDRVPQAYRDHLGQATRGAVPETPKATHPAFAHVQSRVVAGNRSAVDAAATRARECGVEQVHAASAPLTGDASAAGMQVARELMARADGLRGTRQCFIQGGETTVVLHPSTRGRGHEPPPPAGGRCQELALAAARELCLAGERGSGITLLACGTDGRDGSTDAAGAIVGAHTWSALVSRGLDPDRMLRAHEAHRALDTVGALVRTGHTGTNVGDIVVGVMQ